MGFGLRGLGYLGLGVCSGAFGARGLDFGLGFKIWCLGFGEKGSGCLVNIRIGGHRRDAQLHCHCCD